MKRLPLPLSRQRGLTLVEMMIGLALGLFVAAALLTLYANASNAGQNLQRASTQIENGRYATELLTEDLQMAGYYGEMPTPAAYTLPDPCDTDPSDAFAAAPLAVPAPVRGYGAAEALDCLQARSRRAGTDALAVRRLDPVAIAPAGLAASNRQYYLQHSFCAADPVATPLVYSRAAVNFTLGNLACNARNTVRPFQARLYYVASCNHCGSGGDSVPTLKRLDLVGETLVETALVEGVESFRLEYGFDTDGNGSVDTYRTAAAAMGPESLWENVMALKVHLVVRSVEAVGGSTLAHAQSFDLGGAGSVTTAVDGFLRKAYSSTVRLVNPSATRESQ